MKFFSRFILFLFVLSFSFSFMSCRKSVEDKLVGNWKRIMGVENMNSTYNETWEFTEDGTFIIHKDTVPWNPALGRTDEKGRYILNARLRRDYIFTYLEDTTKVRYYEGVWEIIFVRKKTLMLVYRPSYQSIFNQGHIEKNTDRMGSLMFREFEKIQ